jgi:hypothetical protein
MDLSDVLMWSFQQNYHADHMNAAIHCAPVRFSPLTFRLAEALQEARIIGPEMQDVLTDRGRYQEDPGR